MKVTSISTAQLVVRQRFLKLVLFIGFFFVVACSESDLEPSVDPGNITTMAGIAGEFDYDGDGGPALSANLGFITGISVDQSGNIYFVDGAANVVRKVDRSSGIISTVAGTFLGFNVVDPTPFKGDGGPATEAHLNVPYGVAVDAVGNIYITDNGNSVVRKVTISTGKISTIAGKPGIFGYSGDGGLATSAELSNPYDVAVDKNNNVYIVDSQNFAIRKIDAVTGIITTIAGSGPDNQGYAGDSGPAINAKLNSPQGIAVDHASNIYIADSGNHALRKVDSSTGKISTLAGTGARGYDGDGKQATMAKLNGPSRVAVDNAGDIYIADQGSHLIRKIITATGIIHTLAGTAGIAGYSGDGGPAVEAKLSYPHGVAVDADGNVFITESGNSVIRAVKQ
jgi:trimeric autotransporter adhesin